MQKLVGTSMATFILGAILFIGCDSHKNHFYSQSYHWTSGKSSAPAYGGTSSNTSKVTVVNGTSANAVPTTGGGAVSVNYISNNKNSVRSYPNGDIKDEKKKENNARPGILTGGETNDLGKWDLWNDMVKSALNSQINLWKMYPFHRYAVLLQTQDGMPVQGAKVKLINDKNSILWEAITDNTGTAQLWNGIYQQTTDTTVVEIQIEYENISEKIEKPIDFFKGINTKKLNVTYKKSKAVDIAFVVDATGSMGDEIDFLKEELNDIINKTKDNYDDIDLKLGSVFYRCVGNSYTTRSMPLSKEYSAVMDFIKKQNADEGGIEAVEVAFEDAIKKLNWREDARTRLMFVVLDEPSGYYDTIVQRLHDVIQLGAKKGIKIIPIVASGSGGGQQQDRNLEYLMRSTALATNGNYIFISDHSGVGGSHTEPIIDNYKVELLNDIITRTIYNNIYMPEKTILAENEIIRDTLMVSNRNEILNQYLDSVAPLLDDSSMLAQLLPYTDFTTTEELNQNRPIVKMDTTQLLNDIKAEVHTLRIYPNPSNGMIKAEYNTEVEYLYLADLSGKILSRVETNGNFFVTIDLNEYPNGYYLVQYPDKEKWISAKIVLQK